MSNTVLWVLVFCGVASVALVLLWLYARTLRRKLDAAAPTAAESRATLGMAPEKVLSLRGLSVEPILIKQDDNGVRVQIEHRPMLPLMAFMGRDVSAALREATALVSERWGPRWVVVLTAREDGGVSVQRLA